MEIPLHNQNQISDHLLSSQRELSSKENASKLREFNNYTKFLIFPFLFLLKKDDNLADCFTRVKISSFEEDPWNISRIALEYSLALLRRFSWIC